MESMLDGFEEHRGVLLGLAYRMLGSRFDAEDVVQDAWLRWSGSRGVRDARAFLITVTTRLALDRLALAYRKREVYPGTWLPEPLPSEQWAGLGPAETAVQRESLSLGLLRVMEVLTPPQRAVFVLREAFGLPYEEIAVVVGADVPAARQLFRRAQLQLERGESRFEVDHVRQRELLERLFRAADEGDRVGLQELLAEDVVLWSDGGGKVRAALKPVFGAERVARFLATVFGRHPGARVAVVVNGGPAVLSTLRQGRYLYRVELRGDRVSAVVALAEPGKLAAAGL